MADGILSEKLKKVGKEIALHELCAILNCSVNEMMGMDNNFAFRQLYAHHVKKAFELKRAQLNAAR